MLGRALVGLFGRGTIFVLELHQDRIFPYLYDRAYRNKHVLAREAETLSARDRKPRNFIFGYGKRYVADLAQIFTVV